MKNRLRPPDIQTITSAGDTRNPVPGRPSRSDQRPQKMKHKSVSIPRNIRSSAPSQTPFKMISVLQSEDAGSTRALNPSEPIEEPRAHCTGNVENHFPNLNLDVVLSSFHRNSPSVLSAYFKLTHHLLCANQNPSLNCFLRGFLWQKTQKCSTL